MFNYRRIYTLKITQSCSGESDQQMGCIAYTVCELAYMMISANTLKRLRIKIIRSFQLQVLEPF